jgi:hypothetical protein
MFRFAPPAGPPPPPLPLGWVTCQSPDGKTFYHNPHTGASNWEFPSCPSAPFAPHPSAPPLASLNASFDAVVVNPELQSLTDALTSLKIGVHTTCVALAAALQHKGVMCIDDLRLLSVVDARDLLERVGFEKIQLLKLMQAIAPPLAVASAKDTATEDIAKMRADQAVASFCIPALSLHATQRRESERGGESDKLLLWNTAIPGVTHPDVFALDEGNASVVRVRVRGVYQLHAAVSFQNCWATLDVFVNGTSRCGTSISLNSMQICFTGPLIVFDILQLDANDAITLQLSPHPMPTNSRLNLVLLQRL